MDPFESPKKKQKTQHNFIKKITSLDDELDNMDTSLPEKKMTPMSSPYNMKLFTDDLSLENDYVSDQWWTLRTNHDPPIELVLDEKHIHAIPLLNSSRQFRESMDRVIKFDKCICEDRNAWETLFRQLQSTKLSYDKNRLYEVWQLYDFFYANTEEENFKLFLNQVQKDHITWHLYDFTWEGLRSLLQFSKKICLSLDHLTTFPREKEKHKKYVSYKSLLENGCLYQFGYLKEWNEIDLLLWDMWIKFSTSLLHVPMNDISTQCVFEQKLTEDTIYEGKMPLHIDRWLDSHCIWAGGSLILSLLHQPLLPRTDIDLWVFTDAKMTSILTDLEKMYQGWIYYIIQQSVVTVLIDKACPLPTFNRPLQLIYSGENPRDIYKNIQKFDMDYVRCFHDGSLIYYFPECLLAHKTMSIRYTHKMIRSDRIKKAQEKGFQLDEAKFVPILYRKSVHHYFDPDSRMYNKDYILHALELFYPNCKIVTTRPSTMALPTFGVCDDYTMTIVPIENLTNIIDTLTMTESSTIHNNKKYNLSSTFSIELFNVRAPFGIEKNIMTRDNGTLRQISIDGLSEEFIQTITHLDEKIITMLSVFFNKPRQTIQNAYRSSIKRNRKYPSNVDYYAPIMQFKIRSGTTIINGLTMEEMDKSSVPNLFQHKINLKGRVNCVWKGAFGFNLVYEATEIVYFPPSFEYNRRQMMGVLF